MLGASGFSSARCIGYVDVVRSYWSAKKLEIGLTSSREH